MTQPFEERQLNGFALLGGQLIQRRTDGAAPLPINREILRAAGRGGRMFRQVLLGFDDPRARGDRPPPVQGSTARHHRDPGVRITADRVIMFRQLPHLLEDVVDDLFRFRFIAHHPGHNRCHKTLRLRMEFRKRGGVPGGDLADEGIPFTMGRQVTSGYAAH